MQIRFATWNINSIRIRIDLLKDVIKRNNLDILILQEIKCQDSDFPSNAIIETGMNYIFKGQKSYNGVAILSKYPLELENNSLPLYNLTKEDEEARYIEAITTINQKIIRIASVYVPMGGSVLKENETLEESERFNYKLNFYKRLQKRIEEIKNTSNNFNDEYIIFGGDYNVAQEPIDLSHPKQNEGNVGFHILERQSLKEIKNVGLKDLFRTIHPNKQQFSWWDYRTKAFSRNIGWRLDYLLVSNNVINNTQDCYVDMETRAKEKTSDHAPVVCVVDIN